MAPIQGPKLDQRVHVDISGRGDAMADVDVGISGGGGFKMFRISTSIGINNRKKSDCTKAVHQKWKRNITDFGINYGFACAQPFDSAGTSAYVLLTSVGGHILVLALPRPPTTVSIEAG